MALTKVTGQVINDTTGLVVGVTTVGGGLSATDGFFSGIVTAVGNASFSGNLTVGGVLTYEDVTNVDSVGLITARNGIVVGSGITLSEDGDGFFTGIVTATSFVGSGSGLTGVASTDDIRTNTNATFLQNVSLGDVTPRQKLHISASDSGAANMVFTNTTTGTSAGDGFIIGISGAEDAQINMQESANLKFSTADTERVRIDSNGRLIIGHTASTGEARYFQLVGTTADTASAQLIRHSADSSSSQIDLTKSRNATKGSNTIVQDDDVLGQITFRGDDGTDLNSAGASISASVDGTPGSNDMPGRLVFSTTADGASSVTERLRISSTGLMTQTGQTRISQSSTHSHGLNAGTVFEVRGDAIGSGVVDVDYFKAFKIALNDATEWGGQAQFSVGRWEESGNTARSSLMVSLAHGQINSSSNADKDIFMCRSDGYFLVTGDGSWGAGYQTEGVSLRSHGDSTFVRTDSPAVTITRKGNAGTVSYTHLTLPTKRIV